jgi:hypothetical protein
LPISQARLERAMSRLPVQPKPDDRRTLRTACNAELGRARELRDQGDLTGEWHHLERAHILSQPLPGRHVRVHLAMLAGAARRRDRRELVGQVARVLVAGPGSITRRYPLGNTGGADVPATQPMPIPDDLLSYLPTPSRARPPG